MHVRVAVAVAAFNEFDVAQDIVAYLASLLFDIHIGITNNYFALLLKRLKSIMF